MKDQDQSASNLGIIQGITQKGKKFRPSDWADRLSGILSTFDEDGRLEYSSYVSPTVIHGVNCVSINKRLKATNENMYRFLLDFATDNDLRVYDGRFPAKEESRQAAAPKAAAEPPKPRFFVKEVPPEETYTVFNVMSTLREQIRDPEMLTSRINNDLRPLNYKLVAVYEVGKAQAVAVCGYRVLRNLTWGDYLCVEDFATMPDMRDRGLGTMLMNHMKEIAEAAGHLTIQTDSRVGEERVGSHRLLFGCGFRIASYHFLYKP